VPTQAFDQFRGEADNFAPFAPAAAFNRLAAASWHAGVAAVAGGVISVK